MGNEGNDLGEGIRWRTTGSRSGMFFVAIVLGPFALAVLVQVVSHPEMLWKGDYLKWVWFILLGGFGSLFDCIRRAFIRYYTSPVGIERRGLIRRTMMKWSDVEAIGEQTFYTRGGGIEGIIVFVYGAEQTFRPMFSAGDSESFVSMVMDYVPGVLRVDENEGTFGMPRMGDNERLRMLVARHVRRLRRQHGMALGVLGLILVPAILFITPHAMAGTGSWDDVKTALFSLGFFAALSLRNWAALWRLRK